jgi:hypothetical protein
MGMLATRSKSTRTGLRICRLVNYKYDAPYGAGNGDALPCMTANTLHHLTPAGIRFVTTDTGRDARGAGDCGHCLTATIPRLLKKAPRGEGVFSRVEWS